MSENPKLRVMQWIPSEDMDTMAKLCRTFNQGKLYEIFGEYCGLNAETLSERRACGWLYHENGKLCGFALGRRRQGVMRMDDDFVFEETWGPCDGASNELGQLSKRDMERTAKFGRLITSLNFKRPIVLRAATDNQFAHMVARALKARWINGLVIAERKLKRQIEISIPPRFKFRMFKEGDQFLMSEIHKEAFSEYASPKDYKTWATAANCQTTIAAYHEKPIGFIIAENRRCNFLGDFHIAVKPTHQHKGVGTALLRTAFNILISKGAKKVIADYLMLNTSAQILYQKHGFKTKRIYNYFLVF